MVEHATVTVALGARSYPVHVADGLDGLGAAIRPFAGRVFVVTDDVVGPLWGDALRRELDAHGVASTMLAVPAGEAHKHRDTWWSIVDAALEAGVDRRTPIVALGGGVVGDLTGFAAASTLRGVPFVQVPTTLLAMVDSSVGGKTGFNHPRGKNLVGAFHQPALVWAAMATLETLAPREVGAGLGEVVKTAMLGSHELWEDVRSEAARGRAGHLPTLARWVKACVALKAQVVAEDERESGRRAVLNLGHTVGHGIEQAAGYGTVLHGEAVGMGLVVETRYATARGWCVEPDLADQLVACLAALGLPSTLPDVAASAVLKAMEVDKKMAGDTLTLPVCERVGHATLQSLPRAELPALLEYL